MTSYTLTSKEETRAYKNMKERVIKEGGGRTGTSGPRKNRSAWEENDDCDDKIDYW